MTRRWRALGAAVFVVASVATQAIPAAAETAITEVGWWSANPAAAAPPGGFAIQGSPNGSSTSVAAIRVLVTPEPILRAGLILDEVGGLSNENAALQVCPTNAPWKAVAKGPINDAPKPDCTTSAPLVRSSTTGTWSAEVTPFLGGASTVSLMVVVQPANEAPPPTVAPPPPPPIPPGIPPPAPSSPVAGVPVNAEIQFAAPALSIDLLFGEEDAAAGGTGDTDFSDLSTGSGFSSSDTFVVPTDSSSFSGSSSGSFGTFASPVTVAPVADPAGLAAETPVPGQGQVLAGDPARFDVDGKPRSWPFARMLLFVLIAAVIGACSGTARNRLRSAVA